MRSTIKQGLLLILAGLFFTPTAVADTVYFEKDASGTPSFSDNNVKNSATAVKVQAVNTVPAEETPEKKAVEYRELKIRQLGSKPFRFEAKSKPFLKSGHRFVWMLDGSLKKKGVSRLFTARNPGPGSHTVQVSIVDKNKQTLATADRTFTIELTQSESEANKKLKEKPPCKGMPLKAGKQALWQQYRYQQYDKKPKDILEASRWQLDKMVNKEEHEKLSERPCEFQADHYINKTEP